MDKESRFELQKIDCNCNDCFFMERDFPRYKKWESAARQRQLKDFERKKEIGEIRANAQFQFDKTSLLQYGKCSKLKKDISFIPNVCQIETQECFLHRREGKK
jgi:5,10-methylenetetrahydrofolate reductase